VGSYGPKHGRQRRKNTPSQLTGRQQWITGQIRQREDEEEEANVQGWLKAREHGYLRRKYGSND
jgi:hypothetical protein